MKMKLEDELIFLNSGHCAGCGDQKCSFSQGLKRCRNPGHRTYSIGATGVEVTSLVHEVFGIDLQWSQGEGSSSVEFVTKAAGFFCKTRAVQDAIMNEMVETLNSLQCSQYKIGSGEYQEVLKNFPPII